MADISDTASAPREASPGAGAATVRVGLGAALGSGPGTTAPPTIYDVARVAGVSIASVSRVLNGRNNPREETRERVLQAVAELGFAPDGAARALSRPAEGGRRRDRPAVAAHRGQPGPVRRRGREPAVPRHDQPGHRGGRPAARVRPADPLGGRERPPVRRPDPVAGPQERRPDPARPADRAATSWTGWPGRSRSSRWPASRPRPPRTCAATTPAGHARAGPAPGHRPRLRHGELPRRPRRQPGQPGPARDARRRSDAMRGRVRRRARLAGELPGHRRGPGDRAAAGQRGPRSPGPSPARTTRPRSASSTRSPRTASTCPGRWRSPASTTSRSPGTSARS